jgi:hypothetical protein
MSEGGGLVEDVGVPQQGNDEEVEKDEDKECHDVRDSKETEGTVVFTRKVTSIC